MTDITVNRNWAPQTLQKYKIEDQTKEKTLLCAKKKKKKSLKTGRLGTRKTFQETTRLTATLKTTPLRRRYCRWCGGLQGGTPDDMCTWNRCMRPYLKEGSLRNLPEHPGLSGSSILWNGHP